MAFSPAVFAQSGKLERLADEMLFLADEFAGPAAEGAAYQAGAGWFTSATALEPWQVEVSFQGNALIVPSNRQTFTVSNNDFKNVHQDGGAAVLSILGDDNAIVPTAFGGTTDVKYGFEFAGENYEFGAFQGADKSVLAYPFVQASVGLPYETEFAARFLPQLTVDGVSFSTYGLAVKHNFTQYFKFNRKDDIQAAAIIAYNKFDVEYEFGPIGLNTNDKNLGSLNLVNVNSDLWMASLIGSKRYGDSFEVFGALGATNSNFNYAMGGNGQILPLINNRLKDLDKDNTQIKADIGFNIYFNRFKISTMATAGKFFHINAGLHFRI
jgi:hypothetical protein